MGLDIQDKSLKESTVFAGTYIRITVRELTTTRPNSGFDVLYCSSAMDGALRDSVIVWYRSLLVLVAEC